MISSREKEGKKRREDSNPNRKGKQKWYQHLIQTGELNQLDEGMGLGLAAGAAALAAAPYLVKVLETKADKALQRGRNELHLKEILLVLGKVLINNHMNRR